MPAPMAKLMILDFNFVWHVLVALHGDCRQVIFSG
jgi:hypothetical protein